MSQINPQIEAMSSYLKGRMDAAAQSQTPADLAESMKADTTILPPIGAITTDELKTRAHDLKMQIQREDVSRLELRCLMADSCMTIYEHGSDPPPNDMQTVSNAIQDDVRLFVSQIMQDPPTVTRLPDENDGQPIMVPMGVPAIDPQSGQPAIDPTTGQPVEQQFPVTNEVQAKWEQELIDHFWDKSDLDDQLIPVLFNGAIGGWYFPMTEWDCATKVFNLESNVSHRQTCIDTITGPVRAIETATHAWRRWWIDRWQARAMYPHLSKEIEQRAYRGATKSDGVTELGGNVTGLIYGRKMVDLTHLWLRNQPYQPMTPWEAVQYGYVELAPENYPADGQSGDGSMAEGAAPLGIGAPDAQPAPPDQAGDIGNEANPTPQGVLAGGGPNATQQPVLDGASPVGPTFFISGTQTPIDPADIRWPWWYVTRQMTFIDELLADDRVSTAWDGIPLHHFCAIPVPFTPFGQGLPWGKKNLQNGRNRALTNMVDHTDLFAHPILVIPQTAFNALDQRFKEHGASRAGMLVVVDDEVYTRLGGRIQSSIQAEPISTSLTQLMETLKQELTDRADAPEVSGGKQSGDVTGWQTTQLLQQTAANRYEIAAKSVRSMVHRIAQSLRHEIIWRLNIDDLMAVSSKYPAQVVQVMQQRARQNYTANIEVIINNSGGSRGRKLQENIAKFNTRDAITNQGVIDLTTLQQRWNEDPDQQAGLFAKIQQAQAQAAAGANQDKPSEAINIKDVPPEAQVAMLQQAGINISLEQLQAHQQQQQAQKQQEMAMKSKQNGNSRMNQG